MNGICQLEFVEHGRHRTPDAVVINQDGVKAALEIKTCSSYCSLSPGGPSLATRAAFVCSKCRRKNDGVPRSAFPPIGRHGARRQLRVWISIPGKYHLTLPCRRCWWHLNCACPYAATRAPWRRPINRSIAEERPVQAPIRDDNVDHADLPLAILE